MIKLIEGKTFKDLTTFHIGGEIKYYIEVKDKKEIEEAVCFAKKENLNIFTIGSGSDLLVSDSEFVGLVIKFIGNKYTIEDNLITAEAGMGWDELVALTVEKNLEGIECMSGIPGKVGGAPIQNIGAYGQELADNFEKLTAYNFETEEFVEFNKKDCHFGYRESIFKEKSHRQKYLIIDVTFRLNKNAKPKTNYDSLKGLVGEDSTLLEVREAVLKVRNEKLDNPKEVGNAGSFFKNPIIEMELKNKLEKDYPDVKIFPFDEKYKVSAGWLIDKAGWKGKTHKGAGVSSKNALLLINTTGNAKSSDVVELSEMIIKDIDEKFRIKLEREVQLINFE